jgi:hypothetical protein
MVAKVLRGPSKNIQGYAFGGMFWKKHENRRSRIKTRLQKHTPENLPLKIKSMFFNVVGARP